MDLRRLTHLVALADERNFGRAARRVHVTQPAFSRSVQAAESELAMRLFDRGGVEVTCTPAGAFVVERARKLLFDNRCLHRDIDLFRDRQMGDIAFGVGPFPAATLLEPLVLELRSRYPDVHSRVEVNNWKYLLEHLRAEELDFFVADIRDVPHDPDLDLSPLARQVGHFHVRAGHPLLAGKSVKPADLLPFGIASVRLPEDLQDVLKQLFGLASHDRLPIAVECDDVHLLKRIALQGDTVLASTDLAVRDELESGLLRPLTLVGAPGFYNEMGIVSLRGRSHSPMSEFAVGFLREVAAGVATAKVSRTAAKPSSSRPPATAPAAPAAKRGAAPARQARGRA